MLRRLAKHNLRAVFQWKSRDARTDCRKRNGFQSTLIGDPQGMRRGMPQRVRVCFAAKLHAGRMNHEARLQFSARRDGRIADRDAADGIALALDLFSALAANSSGNARAQNQIIVGRIHDRVRIHLRQVALLNDDFLCERFHRGINPFSSLMITTSSPIRRATSRQEATVSSEVWGVLTSSMSFIFGTGLKKCIPMQRSRETVTSVKSVIDREDVLLAKIAPALANLSKMVKSSSFISSSSGTASMMSSASRMAFSTLFAVESSDSARSRTPASTLPRATPSSKDWRTQATPCSSTWRETSSRTVL